MSHVYEGPLATYNSLTDKNLSSYFSNTRMRKHLRKAGLINRRGMIISENQYRLNMARKEHKKHVKDLLAQAIVHKSLDLERTRQVEIKNKLEEIAKIELVRRVRSSQNRKGDEEVLPYLSPRLRRSGRTRPQSAPNADRHEDVIYVDEDGRPLTPTTREMVEEAHRRPQSSKEKSEQIDSRHLYALDSAALKKYALTLSKIEQGEGLVSPYSINQIPTPPRSARSGSRFSGGRLRQRPRTADSRSTSERRTPLQKPESVSQDGGQEPSSQYHVVEGSLMLHRQEPAVMHQGEVQTLCEITMKYHGPNLTLPRDQHDPCQSIAIEQQHCGGNTLTVFREKLKAGDTFTFISRRHRGYPFSLSVYVEGRIDFRISRCCEYKHFSGVRLGGKLGHFSLMKVTGATPCYRCALNAQATPRSLKRPVPVKKAARAEEIREDVILQEARPERRQVDEEEKALEIHVEGAEATPQQDRIFDDLYPDEKGEKHKSDSDEENADASSDSGKSSSDLDEDEEKYDDDFEDEDDKKKESGQYEEDFESSHSSSSSSSSSEDEGPPKKATQIRGLPADGESEEKKQKAPKSRGLDTKRTVQGYSSEEEYLENPSKFDSPYKKKQDASHTRSRGRDSDSSRSRSRSRSSSASSVEKSKPVTIETEIKQKEEGEVKTKAVSGRKDSLSSDSDSDTQVKQRKRRSSSSSSSSSSSKSTPREKVLVAKETVMAEDAVVNGVQESESDEEASSRSITPPPQRKQSPSPELKKVESDVRSPSPEEVENREPDVQMKMEVALEPQGELQKDFNVVEEVRVEEKVYERNQEKAAETVELPEKATYRRMYEEEDRQVIAAPIPDRASYTKMYEDKPVETKSQEQKAAAPVPVPQRPEEPKKAAASVVSTSVDSSSDSSSDEETPTDTERTKRQIDVQAARKRADSISSTSSSESDMEAEKPTVVESKSSPQKLDRKSLSTSTGSTTTSGESSDSETDIEKSKPSVVPGVAHIEKSAVQSEVKPVAETVQAATEAKRSPSPPKEEEKKKPGSESGSSSSDSSSSDSDTETATATETDTEHKPSAPQIEKPPSPTPTPVIETKLDTNENKPTETEKTKAVSETEDSSDSSSSSDSETETETDRTTERKSSPPPPAPPEKSAVEPEKSAPQVVSAEPEKSEPPSTEQTSDKKAEDVSRAKTADSDSDSDSSSDSSTSDSDSDSDKEKPTPATAAPEKKKEFDLTDSDAPHIQSESDGEKLKYNVFGSDSGTDHMHGGNDPDNVASGPVKSSYDAKIGTKPGQPLEGSILHKIEGHSDIDLSSIALTTGQVVELKEYLTKAFNVETLSLRNCGVSDEDFDKHLVDAMIDSKSKLKILNFNLNKLGFKSADEMTDILEDQPEVETLLLHGNPLKDQGVKVLLHGLLDLTEEVEKGKTTCLKELDLGDTQMGDEGMIHVAKFLEKNRTLETLNLNGNKSISEVGWKRLGKALKKNATLKTLSLDYNHISLDGLRALVAGLKDNTTLKTLEMEDTGITKEGGKLIRDLVKCNTSILEISLFPGNDIPEPLLEDIRRYLALNNASTKKS